ncbi:hypothetical protein D9756_009408 [Leucocoprinus leucothites]|uniref:DUF7330 domain-containing protein n=1 Tax=Leucocoprinus leucothites TaxID=201217 RepID=A0A8H5FU61_9AGAR|nr:hypothetical protein D9756_009408 [Leucoagaricus leucothites]
MMTTATGVARHRGALRRVGGVGVEGEAEAEEEEEKKNLKLEVENGGIDVDVHVLPTAPSTTATTARNDRRKRTTIELTLLTPTISCGSRKGRKDGQEGEGFPLIARIHAKSPRPPIHIEARTYTPLPPPSPLLESALPTTPAPAAAVATHKAVRSAPAPTPSLSPPPPAPPLSPPPPAPVQPPPPAQPSRPSSPTTSVHTTHTTNTTNTMYTARTNITNVTSATGTGAGGEGSTIPRRSSSKGKRLKKKRPSRSKPKREPTLTPYYYETPEAAASAGGVQGDVGGGAGGGQVGEELSAPPYTRTSDPHDAVIAVDDDEPPTASISPPEPAPASHRIILDSPPTTFTTATTNPPKTKTKAKAKNKLPAPPHMDTSDLTLAIPRTFHGPLTIHVQVGNLDEHVELSDALMRECVLVKEGRRARGLFVGDFRKGFGAVEGRDAEDDVEEGEGNEVGEVECVCGIEEEEAERKVKRRPVIEFSVMDGDDATAAPGTSTVQVNVTHTRAKSIPITTFSTPTTTAHTRSQSIPSVTAAILFPTSSNSNSNSSSSTDALAPSSSSPSPPPHRPSFLDVDPESLMHPSRYHENSLTVAGNGSASGNGLGQIGWKVTKVQNVNGRVRVVSEHQPIMKSPLRNGAPPVPPLPQSQTPAWVVPKSGLPGVGGMRERGGDGGGDEVDGNNVHVRRVSIERRVFSPTRGWDEGTPVASASEGVEDSGDDGRRTRRASAPVQYSSSSDAGTAGTSTRKNVECTCGARDRRAATARTKRGGGSGSAGGGQTEWAGDRIDISIGKGKVRVLYEDESVDVFVASVDASGGGGVGGGKKGKGKRWWWMFGRGG